MAMLNDVKSAIGALHHSTPVNMTLDAGGSGAYVAQVEANKLQMAMKRRRMKALPSMPTQQDIVTSIVRLQKDATQALEGEGEIRKSLDFVNALSLTLMQSFNAMSAVAEACVNDAAATRHEANIYTEEVKKFKENYVSYIQVFEATIETQGQQIKQLKEEVRTLQGSAKTARIGGTESLHDVSATAVKLVTDLQGDMTESLDAERSDRARHQAAVTDRLTVLEKETIAGLQQVAHQAQRTVEKEVSKVARALSELVDQVGTTCEDVKDDCAALRDELRTELSSTSSRMSQIRSQLESIHHEQMASTAKVSHSEKRQEAILTATERQNQKVQDEISHMYTILSGQLSHEMTSERSRLRDRSEPRVDYPMPSQENSRFDQLGSKLDDDVRMLEAKLEHMLEPYDSS